MPKTELDIELEKQAAAQKEFDDAINDIMDKTDEEIQEIESARAQESDGTGESKKDQTSEPVTEPDPTADPQNSPDQSSDQTLSGTGAESDNSALHAEIEELKAELKKERQRTSSWDGRIRAANDKVKLLEAENAKLTEQLTTKADAEANEQDQTDQEVMETFKATFPELVQVVDILEKKIKATTPAKSIPEPEATPDTTEQEPAPEVDKANSGSKSEHYVRTRKAHPDLDEAVNSGVLLTWLNKQPDYIRPYLESVYYGTNGNGSSQQVIDLVTEFKNKSGWQSTISTDTAKNDKLKSMLESEGSSAGAKTDGPDKNDFNAAAKEAFK
jgi:hypothetical protein